jgi:CheY-like chemotaxis protein
MAGVTVVRPSAEVRERVLRLLREAGLEAGDADVLPAGFSDDETVAALRQRRSRLLVIPFRQPTTNGGRANGIDLVQRLEREAPELARTPIVLPVTVFGAGAVRLLLGESNLDETLTRATRHRILVVQEEELDEARVAQMVRLHVRLHGGSEAPVTAC